MGLMTIEFYHSLYVPVFAKTSNLSLNATSRKLATEQPNMTLAQFIDANVLKITLGSILGYQSVNWTCLNFTSTQLLI